MNIQINGANNVVKSDTIFDLLIELNYGDAVVATALNGDFIPETLRKNASLKNGDQIEILAPMQGG
ncbi:MAG: sulfur carrier protein ThiS [Hyphomicrobiales bacterium]